MVALTIGLIAVLTGAATTWLVHTKPSREDDPDARFWYGFIGFCTGATLLLVTVSLDRRVGALSLAMVVAGVMGAGLLAGRSVEKRKATQFKIQRENERDALMGRHDSVLRAWGRYTLDPAAAIDCPGMNDVAVPEVSVLAKVLAQAEQLRRLPQVPAPTPELGYRQAIERLEEAFRRAEQATSKPGVPEQVPPPIPVRIPCPGSGPSANQRILPSRE